MVDFHLVAVTPPPIDSGKVYVSALIKHKPLEICAELCGADIVHVKLNQAQFTQIGHSSLCCVQPPNQWS